MLCIVNRMKIMAFLLCLAFLGERVALALPTPDAATAKQLITRRGVGKRIKIHEADGAVIRGKITALGENSFGLQVGHDAPADIPFARVRQVDGPGLSTGAKVGLGIGITLAGAAAVTAAVIGVSLSHGFGLHF